MSWRLGERFAGEAVARDSRLIEKFVIWGPEGEQEVIGRSGAKTHFARVGGAGLYWIGYRSRRSFNRLEAEPFEAYLREEGLESVIAVREGLGEGARAGLEVYSRCAKALVAVGEDGAEGYDHVFGFPLELVFQESPYALVADGDLTVGLLYDGKPLKDSVLVAVNRSTPERLVRQRTDDRGQAAIRFSERGVWMVTAIHMVRAAAGVEADWESFWASLVFELPEKERKD
jgi:hypothetical protein